jgi:1-acyl-sn-glycerol-3-phosphate acyltransferase
MLRATFVAIVFFALTALLLAIQWLLRTLRLPGWGMVTVTYYHLLCLLLRIRVRVIGEPVRNHAVLFISNHVSWADILAIGSVVPTAYVSKSEIAHWPVIGTIARALRTVFIDRAKRQQTGDAIAEIVSRIAGGTSVVLFPEGTSSDGNRVLPFRSALIGAAKESGARSEAGLLIQPMSISYTGLYGIPMGRQHRPLIAWYGDLDFMPHLKTFIERGAVDVVITYGEPVAADATADRKAMTKRLQDTVRRLMAAALLGRTLAVPAAE